jgi:dihydroorotate dehydrogenase electron transfer subunit
MKCGVGVCGSCCIDPSGLRVCRDGPVFTGDKLLKSEFGHYMRDASGRKRNI